MMSLTHASNVEDFAAANLAGLHSFTASDVLFNDARILIFET